MCEKHPLYYCKLIFSMTNSAGKGSLLLTDDISTASHNDFNDSFSSVQANTRSTKQTFMDGTQAKIVSSLANPKDEASFTWKRMKKLRDERNANLERRKAREDMIYNFKRAVHSTEQNEFHRAYREQFSQQEHIVKKNHQDRKHERRALDENLDKKIATKKKQQQDEGRYMRAMLRDSADQARASLHEEIVFNKMNKELSGLVKSQSTLDISTSSLVAIPDHLKNKMASARRWVVFIPYCRRISVINASLRSFSLADFEAARSNIKQYYESSMSERIAIYARSRERAVTRASEIGKTSIFTSFNEHYNSCVLSTIQTTLLICRPYEARTCSSTRCRPPRTSQATTRGCTRLSALMHTRRQHCRLRLPRREVDPVRRISPCRSTSRAGFLSRKCSSSRISVCIRRMT